MAHTRDLKPPRALCQASAMATDPSAAAPHWWERPWFLTALILLSAVPLVWPDIPPLVDLPGHMGRYRLQLDLDRSPFLQQFYTFEWALIGNLGLDLLVVPLSKLFGLELAVKLVVLAIPPMTVAGFLLVAREVHGRIPPTALFALPFVFNFPFMFGFVNFALSMAFAFLAFGLWLQLGRLERFGLRAALFMPLTLALWVVHIVGWGTLGLLAACAELVREEKKGGGLVAVVSRAIRSCLVLAAPLALMLLWRSGEAGGETGDWFNLVNKFDTFLIILQDRWMEFDQVSLLLALGVIYFGARMKAFGWERLLGLAAALLLLVFLCLPRIVFGSAFADMRLLPFVIAVALLAIKPPATEDYKWARAAALAGLAFFLVRTAGTTASFLIYDASYDRELAALNALPRNARVAAFTHYDCDAVGWPRLVHLPGIAIVRREAFSNDQWVAAGAQLLRVNYPAGGTFVSDPSQLVTRNSCRTKHWRRIDDALREVPRNAFDYVWLLRPPPYDARLTAGLTPVWRDGTSVLFRIER